jgi:hypothetical protein
MGQDDAVRRWVRTWEDARPRLEAIRRREIREADNLRVLAVLEGAFNQALQSQPPRCSSGMVQMQQYFAKIRESRPE